MNKAAQLGIREVVFDDEGNPKTEISKSERSANFDQIVALVDDPNVPLTHINRLIAVELAVVTRDIANLAANPLASVLLKTKEAQVKALRELSRTLQENDILSKKDILNFDGPKFQYVIREFVAMVKKAIVDSGSSEEAANDVLRNFRDLLATREHDLRREVEKIENSK